jgi:hypothetical protein
VAKKNTIDLTSTSLSGELPIKGGLTSSTSADTSTSTNSPVPSNTIGVTTYPFVSPFGVAQNSIAVYPNDTVQLNVYNAVDQYLETDFRINTYKKDGDIITLDLEKDVSNLGYISGKYKAEYEFFRNYLGSGDAHKLQIQEISADGLEIRVIPTVSSQYGNVDFTNYFSDKFFTVSKSQVLPNLYLHKDPNTSMRVFDYVQDKFTFPTTPYSILFKLNSSAPSSIAIGDFIWLAQQVSEPISDFITIIPPKRKSTNVYIAGPNWDALNKENTSISTQYKDWDDLLTTNTETSQQIINKLMSSSFIEGIPLNIDYKSFDNFITFGSATERLYNFKYKMQLLETYEGRISELTTGLIGLPSSSATSSVYYQSNVIDAQTKRAALLGTLDGYENYLYSQTSSYVSNSYGEFYPTTWPKQTSTPPYVNYSHTSSQVEAWFDGAISSASLYDKNNDKALFKLIPAHVLEDSSNEEYVLFTQMIGHYFDLQFAYVKQMTATQNRDESLLEGFSKDLVYHVARNLGVDFENGNSLEELWNYSLGIDATGSLSSTYGTTVEDKTKETWKRIINNLPYLLKTKGTERGVRALINCFGIPQTILRIREYGGAEPEFDSKTDLVYERFNYALKVGYNNSTKISIPWDTIDNALFPMATQLRVKMTKNQTQEQVIMEVPNRWQIKAFQQSGYEYIGFFLSGSSGWATASVSSSIYNGDFHSITLQRSLNSDTNTINQNYNLIVKTTNYEKVVGTQTASLSINGTTSSSYNSSFTSASNVWIPGSGSNTLTGSVQEFRYWTTPLQDIVLNSHALAPTSYQGDTDGVFTGSTSSFNDLSFRLCLGADNKKINYYLTSSYTSQQPNQQSAKFNNNTTNKEGVFYSSTSSIYEPVTEIHSLEWPDLGGNRSISNKIRIDSTIRISDILYRDNKVERALSDNYPIDSSRLGVFFSPTNEVNQDIAEQFGGISIDDLIGDPSHVTLDSYPDLDRLQYEYTKKYSARIGQQNYIRLMKHYDASLFKLIKKFVPYRANTQVGLVIESDILHRNKLPSKAPSTEQLHYSASITIPEVFVTVGGFVQDGDGEPFRDTTGYVPAGVIDANMEYVTLTGAEQFIHEAPPAASGILINEELLPKVDYDMVVDTQNEILHIVSLSGNINEYNNIGIANQPSAEDSLMTDIDLGITSYGRDARVKGSQYAFMTYATSGSGTSASLPYLVTSSRYDYHEALPPAIQSSRRSEISNLTNNVYDRDIYGSKAFTDTSSYGSTAPSKTTYSSSAALYTNRWTQDFGLRLASLDVDGGSVNIYNSSDYWYITGSTGLSFSKRNITPTITASAQIPAFFYNNTIPQSEDYLYKINITTAHTEATLTASLELHYGNLDNGLTTSSIYLSTTETNYTFIVSANGPWLGLRFYSSGLALTANTLYVKSLSVECLNYRAEVQDFHLKDSYGMRNARYDGCKMTSADYNIDSPDTSDGGPVITVTVGGGKQLSQNITPAGNFQIN